MPLLLGGMGGIRGVVLLLHLLVLGGVAFLEARRGRPDRRRVERVLADFHFLLLLPALYAELPWLMAGLSDGYHDQAVMAWEAALFGGQPAWTWAEALSSLWLSELLHAAYLAYYPIIYVPPLLLWLKGREPAFHVTVGGIALSMVACYAVFVLWPVQGPRYLGAPEGVPAGPFRGAVLAILERGSSRGAAFPSSHVAVAVTQALLALHFQRALGVALSAAALLLAVGTVYGGFHYLVDALAGALVGAAAALLASPLDAWIRSPKAGFTWPAKPR